eukprot:gene5415-6267_t
MMQEEGEQIGRFKVRSLMRELELVSKQPGSHAYKKATVERPDIPNVLNREFDVQAPNQVWCGDITYIWGRIQPVVATLDCCTDFRYSFSASAGVFQPSVFRGLELST